VACEGVNMKRGPLFGVPFLLSSLPIKMWVAFYNSVLFILYCNASVNRRKRENILKKGGGLSLIYLRERAPLFF
jgi:hypothetical protein